MTCGLIMTKDPVALNERATVGDAAKMLVAHRWLRLPVVDAAGRFAGMFGVDDLLCQLVPRVALAGGVVTNLRFMSDDPDDLNKRYREIATRRVSEVADRDVVTLHPDTPEIEALRLFCKTRETLAVVDRETRKLLGVISPSDALRAITGLKVPAGA
ncbi:MAG TPA: CBS domain-containing protein [Rhizomicrobium sp.]|nr:CBS domain-containing protein [Rhizomicrobium sp.]